MNTKLHFSSQTDMHSTPQSFFDKVNAEFNFNLDVCASVENAKCERYFTKEINGLEKDWAGNTCWMNPPYGREIGRWVRKAYESSQNENTIVVCLIPSRTDTAWWHEYVMKATEIKFVRGRLKFGAAANSAPFPSALVIFKNRAA